MSETKVVKGYKVFNPDWTCRGKQYVCGEKFEEDVKLSVCNTGMHFCRKAADCFDYYDFDKANKVAEVIAYGDIKERGNKCCTNKLEILREIPWEELLEMVNTGEGCTGLKNSGNYNSGNYNSGCYNSGHRNSGHYNSGNYNSGNWNSGNYNSGNYNSGHYNSGNYNSGNRNSGDYNRGHCNSGNYNKTNYSNGWFNTVEPKITMFNQISQWTKRDSENSEARIILDFLAGNLCEWIWSEDMTDEEKKNNPEYKTAGGYLKKHNMWENARISGVI